VTALVDTPGPSPSGKQAARRLRIIAVIVLVLGIACAEVVYVRAPGAALPDDPSLIGYDKAATRQTAMLYGQQGVITQEWLNDLKHPGTQATLILIATTLAAAGCLYFAKLLDRNS
jgi:hypothetical protein